MSYLAHILPWAERPTPARASVTGLAKAKKLWGMLAGAWQRVLEAKGVRATERRLRVVERVPLGDKQFVALLELDGATYLASGGHGVPLSLIPAHQAASVKKASAPTPRPARALNAAGKEPKRVRAKSPAPVQNLAACGPAAARATTKATVEATASSAESSVDVSAAPEIGAVRPVARRKRESKVRAEQPKFCARCAASFSSQAAAAEAAAPPVEMVPASSKNIVKLPKIIVKTPVRKPLPERGLAAPEADPSALSNETSAHEIVSEPERSASTAFAALLELRMLASQVFEELDAEPTLRSETAAPTAAAKSKTAQVAAAPIREQKEPSRLASRLHRIRGRLSAYACFLVLLLLPAIAQAQAPPGFSPPSHHEIAVARGSPFELGAAGLNLLAEAPLPNGDIRISGLGGSSASWSIVVLLTLLTLIPGLLLCITPFARLLIVFHFLRQALGLQTTPSNQTLIGLSLILTFFLMQPTGEVIYRDAIVPAQAGKLTPLDAVVRAGGPMRHFMAHYVREKDAELFLEIAKEPRPRTVEDMSFRVLLPSYILSELKAGFQIGTVLFLPFLIVDMVVASITTSVGMMQLPPVVISTPLKLLLFLMVDGWHLLIGALMRSFN